MDEKIVISERNRDGAKIWLEKVENNIYSIHTTPNKKYVLEYCCCNYDNLPDDATEYDFMHEYNGKIIKGKYISFDPAGGPYMSIGSRFGEYALKRIFCENGNGRTLFEMEK